MVDPFAALEQRVNAAVTRRLANASATYEGSEPFGVIFDAAAVNPLDEAASAGLIASFEQKFTPSLAYGKEIVINGTSYKVVGGLEPDSSGWLDVQVQERI
jgi:hypothetical protein